MNRFGFSINLRKGAKMGGIDWNHPEGPLGRFMTIRDVCPELFPAPPAAVEAMVAESPAPQARRSGHSRLFVAPGGYITKEGTGNSPWLTPPPEPSLVAHCRYRLGAWQAAGREP